MTVSIDRVTQLVERWVDGKRTDRLGEKIEQALQNFPVPNHLASKKKFPLYRVVPLTEESLLTGQYIPKDSSKYTAWSATPETTELLLPEGSLEETSLVIKTWYPNTELKVMLDVASYLKKVGKYKPTKSGCGLSEKVNEFIVKSIEPTYRVAGVLFDAYPKNTELDEYGIEYSSLFGSLCSFVDIRDIQSRTNKNLTILLGLDRILADLNEEQRKSRSRKV